VFYIGNNEELSSFKDEMYQYKKKKYRVEINFHYYETSVREKMELLDEFDKLNINDKVGKIRIKLKDDNSVNE